MAKQVGPILLKGTIHGLTFYKSNGENYARPKSSLTKKKVKTARVFAGSRAASERFSLANKMASKVYQALPPEQKQYKLFPKLKKSSIRLFHLKMEPKAIKALLEQELAELLESNDFSEPKISGKNKESTE